MFDSILSAFKRRRTVAPARSRTRLCVELLEDRTVPANIVVTTASDLASHTGTSLRDAILQANAHSAAGIADVITFDAAAMGTSTLSFTRGALRLTAGSGLVTIVGSGITINAGGTSGIYHIDTGAQAEISGLTFIGGAGVFENTLGFTVGGAIRNSGRLTLNQVHITNNNAQLGGGIFNLGYLVVNNTEIAGNIAARASNYVHVGAGGGIYNGGTAIVSNSIINNNLAGSGLIEHAGDGGGGIHNAAGGVLTLNAVTLSTNSASGYGGAIDNAGTLTLVDGRITDNNVFGINPGYSVNLPTFGGGGIYSTQSLSMHFSILAGNSVSSVMGNASTGNFVQSGIGPQISGYIWTGTNNLIVDGSGMYGIKNKVNGNRIGTTIAPIEPLFDTLVTAPAVTHPTALLSANPGFDGTFVNGTRVTLSTDSFGLTNGKIQWQVSIDGGTTYQNIAGFTSNTLTFIARPVHDGYRYRAVHSNAFTRLTTGDVGLNVQFAPQVTGQPTATNVLAGTPALFSVGVSGNPTPGVQWQVSADGGKSFADLPGEVATTLSVAGEPYNHGTYYRAVVTNEYGQVTSKAAPLKVQSPPAFVQDVESVTVTAGQTASFSVAAVGNPGVVLQWQYSTDGGATFTNVSGANARTLTFLPNYLHNGFLYRVVASNALGTMVSSNALLTVRYAPRITLQPTSSLQVIGLEVVIRADATANPAPGVQWQISGDGKNYTNIIGANDSTLRFVASTTDPGRYYRAIFSNALGTAVSNAAYWRSPALVASSSTVAATAVKAARHTANGWVNVPTVTQGVAAMLPGTLTAEPGLYYFNGLVFDCSTPGFYTFVTVGKSGALGVQRRLFYPSFGTPGFNLDELLSLTALWTVVGDFDRNLTMDQIYAAAAFRIPVIQCEQTCLFVQALLAQRGVVDTRLVRVLTSEALTGFDDGHVMLEVRTAPGGNWVMVDPLLRRRWAVSVKDYFAMIVAGTVPQEISYGTVTLSPVNTTLMLGYAQVTLGDRDSRDAWTRRVFGIPFIQVGTLSYGYMPPGRFYDGVLPYGFVLLTQGTWESMFY